MRLETIGRWLLMWSGARRVVRTEVRDKPEEDADLKARGERLAERVRELRESGGPYRGWLVPP